jgi:hypothetical protein
MSEQLFKAVIKQLGFENTQDEYFQETISDICAHGADCGFSGFIYYHETTEFFDKNKKEIIALAKEQSSEFGMGLLEFIASNNCLNGNYLIDEIGEIIFSDHDIDESEQVKNALSWYALEEAARYYENEGN